MSETGGFSTTQDTVIGIQAMSAYAILMDSATSMSQNIQTHLLDSNGSKIKSTQPIVMDDSNKMIVKIQNLEFTDQTTQVEMNSNGQGTIYAQIVQHYYIPDNTIEPFKVEVIVNENDPAINERDEVLQHQLRTFAWILKQRVMMVRLEVVCPWLWSNIPLVMAINHIQSLVKINSLNYKRATPQKRHFTLTILKKERTVNVCFVYQTEVANPKPAFVTVQDYYETSARSDKLFFLKGRQNEESCDLCGCACQSECPSLTNCEATVGLIESDITTTGFEQSTTGEWYYYDPNSKKELKTNSTSSLLLLPFAYCYILIMVITLY
jgi:hypothetical protein